LLKSMMKRLCLPNVDPGEVDPADPVVLVAEGIVLQAADLAVRTHQVARLELHPIAREVKAPAALDHLQNPCQLNRSA
jgi:hypothetical protein